MYKKTLKMIKDRQATIGVVGLGYVGLPLALGFAHKGFTTLGIDTSEIKIQHLLKGESYITDVSSKEILKAVCQKQKAKHKGSLIPTTDFVRIRECQVVIICVPTPIKRRYTPDISFILSAVRAVAKNITKGTLVVLESTTYPGTTQELILPELEKSGLRVGKDIYLSFSPERVDPGNATHTVTKIPKVVGGVTKACNLLTKELYATITPLVHMVSSPKAAEMTKLLENTFRLVNIGWVNEAAMMCQQFGIDIWEVIEAAKTKPFGFMPFYPGLGVGGHCIPEDPIYLYWKAKQHGYASRFIKLSADINAMMPHHITRRIEQLLQQDGKKMEQASVLILGVTYKKDVKDLRKSPSIKLIDCLKRQKVNVSFYDPLIPYLNIDGLKMDGVLLNTKTIKQQDYVIVAVDHSDVNYKQVLASARKVFDLKNVYKEVSSKKIIKL